MAAGNNNADANNYSPSRVRKAITVAATDINDTRASFSNFGNAVDIFAPGVSITSAWWDGGINVISGTSMAAPVITGTVAQYLQLNASNTPSQIQDAIVTSASWDKVASRGAGSPNTLSFNGPFALGPPLKPLYRYWNGAGTDHFYTNSWDEVGAGSNGYGIEKVEGYMFPTQQSGTLALHRYWSSSRVDHFYTTNFSELGNGANGYVYEGVIGYVFPNPGSGAALHRYWNSSITNHFYTTNFGELGGGSNGYVYEGVIGYVIQ